jgi:hypothetical protein
MAIIGKRWVPACEEALTAEQITFKTTDNQIIVEI